MVSLLLRFVASSLLLTSVCCLSVYSTIPVIWLLLLWSMFSRVQSCAEIPRLHFRQVTFINSTGNCGIFLNDIILLRVTITQLKVMLTFLQWPVIINLPWFLCHHYLCCLPWHLCLVWTLQLGGTIGDIEGMPFIEAFRQFQFRVERENFCCVLVSLILQVVGQLHSYTTTTSR